MLITSDDVPDCSYFECQNLPTCMLKECQDGECSNFLHHLCQVAHQEQKEEEAQNILEGGFDIPMFKRCQEFLYKYIETQMKMYREL
eukprot:3065754-Ditylum_brightwellii.AAC.1